MSRVTSVVARSHSFSHIWGEALGHVVREGEGEVNVGLTLPLPYDWEAVATSVRKTGKVIVAHEDSKSWGYGAEIAARIADELFEHLDAPVRRIGALDCFVGYSPVLEDAILPQVSTVADALRDLKKY